MSEDMGLFSYTPRHQDKVKVGNISGRVVRVNHNEKTVEIKTDNGTRIGPVDWKRLKKIS